MFSSQKFNITTIFILFYALNTEDFSYLCKKLAFISTCYFVIKIKLQFYVYQKIEAFLIGLLSQTLIRFLPWVSKPRIEEWIFGVLNILIKDEFV